MTVGYLAAGKCWETAQEAIDAHYSAQSNSATTWADPNYGTLVMIVYPYKSGANWYYGSKKCGYAYGGCTDSWGALAPSSVYGSCTMPATTGGTTETGLPAGFDYSVLGALFAFSFSVVVGLYLFGRAAGSIVNIFKPK